MAFGRDNLLEDFLGPPLYGTEAPHILDTHEYNWGIDLPQGELQIQTEDARKDEGFADLVLDQGNYAGDFPSFTGDLTELFDNFNSMKHVKSEVEEHFQEGQLSPEVDLLSECNTVDIDSLLNTQCSPTYSEVDNGNTFTESFPQYDQCMNNSSPVQEQQASSDANFKYDTFAEYSPVGSDESSCSTNPDSDTTLEELLKRLVQEPRADLIVANEASAEQMEKQSYSDTSERHHPYQRPKAGKRSESRKERKRLQNQQAATRYRQKKKQETEDVMQLSENLTADNKHLREEVSRLEREIKYMKELLTEVYKARGLIKNAKDIKVAIQGE